MKYYKVLYRDVKNNLMSVGAVFDHPSELILDYTPGKETVAPEGTKLFIFDGYINAIRFVKIVFPDHLDWTEIWEVKAEPIRSVISVLSIHGTTWKRFGAVNRKRLRSYWRCVLRDNARTILTVIKAPVGTLVRDSVILKKRACPSISTGREPAF